MLNPRSGGPTLYYANKPRRLHSPGDPAGSAYRFAFSGSSARKLERLDVNLLAGRAINRQFFPLTAAELNFEFDPDSILRFGLLPQIAYQSLGGELRYWRTPSGSEVDFIWTRADRAVGIEVKASATWRPEFGAPLRGLLTDGVVKSGFAIYTGTAELKDGPLRVLPFKRFLEELNAANVLG